MRFFVHAPTSGVPYLGSVMTPVPNKAAQAWSSRGRVYGQPGTQAIVVRHQPIPWSVNDLANVGISHSHCAPDVIYPPLYWEADYPKEHAPVSRISDNQMPVPALRARNIITATPYRARKGGQRQVVQPQVVQTWKPWRGMNG